jgi:hypothetical protein
MGTYPTTPSLVLGTGEDLQKHINANKELIGKPILSKFGADLPYLPKVNYTSIIPQPTTHRLLRYSRLPKLYLFRSTQTKTSQQNSTRKTRRSLATLTTSPKSQSL